MEGPRAPTTSEYTDVLRFLETHLRPDAGWSIEAEYPTAITPTNIHNMRIITEEKRVLSHAVLKPLIIRSPAAVLKVGAIGSVVTESEHRNQGLSKKIISDCLAEAEKQSCDIAILWTNLYEFYRKLDFELGGIEIGLTFANEFAVPESVQLKFMKGANVSAESLLRLYNQHTVASARTTEELARFLKIPQTQVYTAWGANGQLEAYAIEGKGADLTGYVHEWGGKASSIIALVSHIRREKNAPITMIIPGTSENLLQKIQPFATAVHHGYLGMIKIVNFESLFAKLKRAARALGIPDLVLERKGSEFIFGVGSNLVIINDERALIPLIFGPSVDVEDFSQATKATLANLFPLPFWIWGWDSI